MREAQQPHGCEHARKGGNAAWLVEAPLVSPLEAASRTGREGERRSESKNPLAAMMVIAAKG